MEVHAMVLEEMNFDGSDYENIPVRMRDSIMRYALNHKEPGKFLTSVICNDLRGAVCNADDQNLSLIKAYVLWFCNRCPSFLVGLDNFKRHIEAGREVRPAGET